MTRHDSEPIGPDDSDLSLEQATTLLKMGIREPKRPVDDLVDRLCEEDGPGWLEHVLKHGPLHEIGAPREIIGEGRGTVAQLTAIKEESKLMLRRAAHQTDDRLAALAGYFMSIAAALHHHDERIGGRGRSELRAILLELSAVTKQPYRDVLANAAMRIDETA